MIRLYKTFLCVLVVLLCAPAPAALAQGSVFAVEDVHVDVTAENAIKAREQAFEQAQRDAFRTLAERLMPDSQFASFAVPEVSVISPLIKDFEVTSEQLSAVRYVGTYTFRFKENAVRNYFSYEGISYSDVGSKPVLILPFYQWGSRTVLWEDNNPFLAAWQRSASLKGLVPVVVPIGDLQDVGDVSGDQSLTYNSGRLEGMLARYAAGEAVIIIAVPHMGPDGQGVSALDMGLYRTDRNGPEFVQTLTEQAAPGASAEVLFDGAVLSVRKALQRKWKEQTAAAPVQASRLRARVSFGSMAEWVATRGALERAPGVSSLRVVSLTPREARVEIGYHGDESQLRLALSQSDIVLSGGAADRMGNAYGNPYMGGSGEAAQEYELYLNRGRSSN